MKAMNPWTEEEENILGQVIEGYTEGGVTHWTHAFNEHPEWKEQLTAKRSLPAVLVKGHDMKKKGNRLAAYNGATTTKKKGKGKGGKRKGAGRPKNRLEARTEVDASLVDTAEPTAPTEKPKWEVNACPNCTNNVRIMNDAYARKGITAPPHCPFCTFPLKLARNVINIALRHPQGV